MKPQHTKIKSDGTPEGTEIWINGQKIENAKAATIRAEYGSLVTVTLELYVDELQLEGMTNVVTSTLEGMANVVTEDRTVEDDELISRALVLRDCVRSMSSAQRLALVDSLRNSKADLYTMNYLLKMIGAIR